MNAHATTAGAALRYAALAASVALLGFTLAQGGAIEPATTLPSAPALPQPDVACELQPTLAEARAHAADAGAASHVARYPFAAREALAAAAAFAYAEACYSRAGDARASAAAHARAAAWHGRVERDYADHVLRYRLALTSGRVEHLDEDERYLLELVGGQDNAFTRWLLHAHAARGTEQENDP